MALQNIHVTRGKEWNGTGTITLNGTAVNITGFHFRFTAKYNAKDADSAAAFILTDAAATNTCCNNCIVLTTPASGIITIRIPSTVYGGSACGSFTPIATPKGHRVNLVYDLTMFDGGALPWSVMSGQLIIDPDTTQTSTAGG